MKKRENVLFVHAVALPLFCCLLLILAFKEKKNIVSVNAFRQREISQYFILEGVIYYVHFSMLKYSISFSNYFSKVKIKKKNRILCVTRRSLVKMYCFGVVKLVPNVHVCLA